MNDAFSQPLPGLGERRSPLDSEPANAARASAADETTEERALIAAARGGSPGALERLLKPHERSLYLLCRGILDCTEDAEDAVQETYFRALSSFPRFRGDAGMRTWLTRIAVNVCLEWKRRDQAKESVERVFLGEPVDACPQAEALSRLSVFEALAAVSRRGRAMLLLKEREGWTAAEIARATQTPERKVYYELQKAYTALADWRRARQVEEEQA